MKNAIVIIVLIIFFAFVVVVISTKLLAPSPSGPSQQSQERNPKDINWDGKIDVLDANIVSSVLGCKKSDPCWNKVIGKTVTGDNPIYASDCDLNHDGVIDQKDIQLISNNQ